MKKLMILSFIAGAVLVACNKKVVPSSGTDGSTGKTEAAKVETTKTDEQNKADADAKQKIEAATRSVEPAPIMTDMDNGKNVYTTKCASCHAAKNTGDFTFFQWQGILRSMVPKAKLSADEERQVTAYIKANAKQ
jgi:cytochrome c5